MGRCLFLTLSVFSRRIQRHPRRCKMHRGNPRGVGQK